ncbi:MAG: type II secretion system F family protein [Elusimicrobia bacterium]|nr:type II secretion system F family protein [Elusimicrobiota bacterium]
MRGIRLAAAVLTASGAWLASAAAPAFAFTPKQMDLITDPQNGAEVRCQYFYHYLKRDRDPNLVLPAWVDSVLAAMIQTPRWRDPEEGVLNEAQLWQAPASVLYEFFQHTRKTFPPDRGGVYAQPGSLIRDYEDARTRFQMSLDRLYRAKLGDSLGGRGRSVMAAFELILKEMDSVLDALSSQDAKRYTEAVLAVGALTNQVYGILQQPPRGHSPAPPKRGAHNALPLLLMMVGALCLFGAALSVAMARSEMIDQKVDEFWSRSRGWAQEFNRQFIQIKVQYLVIVPLALGMLMGMATLNVFGFLLLSAAGAYVGTNLPRWLLNFIRARRGKRVEAQLMDAMILMSNALKSGLDIVQGFELVSRDLVPPISEEFGLVIKNYQLGTPFEKALEGMESRIASRLLTYVIKAIAIQRSVGGNLTKIFDRIVENIREEGKLEEKMQALTAQQRIQSVVVGIMPWLMVGIMFLFQPETMSRYYFSPLGFLTVASCVIWMSIGMGIVRKLADIQV